MRPGGNRRGVQRTSHHFRTVMSQSGVGQPLLAVQNSGVIVRVARGTRSLNESVCQVGQPLLAVQNSGVIVRVPRRTSSLLRSNAKMTPRAGAPSLRFLQGWGFSDSALLFPVPQNPNARPRHHSRREQILSSSSRPIRRHPIRHKRPLRSSIASPK
jgi:hypothetical protein